MRVFEFKNRGGVGMGMYNTDEVRHFQVHVLPCLHAYVANPRRFRVYNYAYHSSFVEALICYFRASKNYEVSQF